jgi:predicted N-formylglutamate amidohydrolase
LLGPGDPAAVVTLNGAGKAPFLILCDHASRAVPKSLGDLGVEPSAWDKHVAYDIGAAPSARRLSARFDAPCLLSGYSRLVLDCNRPIGHQGSIPAVSDGIAIPGNVGLSEAQRRLREEALFHPYHRALAGLIAERLARGQVPALISIHSCTPVMNGISRPWHFGILWNRDGRIAEKLIRALAADPALCVGDNQPYSGRLPGGYTLRHHAEPAGLPHVTVEIRQDLVPTDAEAERWADRFGDALEPILADPALYRVFERA